MELGQRPVSDLHKLHLVVRTMTALQGMRFQSNYRWNRCEMGMLGGGRTVRIERRVARSRERGGTTQVGKNLIYIKGWRPKTQNVMGQQTVIHQRCLPQRCFKETSEKANQSALSAQDTSTHTWWRTDTCSGHLQNLKTWFKMTPESSKKNTQGKETWRTGPKGERGVHPGLTMTTRRQRNTWGGQKEVKETGLLSEGQNSTGKACTSRDLFVNVGPPTVKSPQLPVCAAL